MELIATLALAFFPLLGAAYLIVFGMVRRAGGECVCLLRAWAEGNGMVLLRSRLIWVTLGGDSPPRAIYRLDVEESDGRRRAVWASIVGRRTGQRRFIPSRVDIHTIRAPRFSIGLLMVLILYGAVDLAALRAVLTYGSFFGLGTFLLLTLLVPFAGYLRWRTGRSGLVD